MGNNIVFYFSGTGNSLVAARKIAEALGNTELSSIPGHFGADLSGYERVGFVYPIYFGGVPLIVKNFVESLNIPENTYLFAIATRGGVPQNGLKEMNALLSMKGRELDFGTLLLMGANYILLYGKLFNAGFANRHADKVLPKLAAAIRNKEKRPCGSAKPGPTSSTEHARSKVHEAALDFLANSDCISCGLCAKICPVCNIKINNGKPMFGAKCEQCMACIQWCPQEAINYKDKTQKRKRYHHPGITAQDLLRE